jgi:hypothetical protein
MPDRVIVTAVEQDGKYAPCPEGSFAAICVDVVDLGEKVEQFEGAPEKLVRKVVLVYRTAETNERGEHYDVAKEFSVSMHEKASLRKHLEAWRGKAYGKDDVERGVQLDKLVGAPAFIGVGHKQSKKGRTYAVLMSVMKMPSGMSVPSVKPYERQAFWEERKAEYAQGAAEFRARVNAPSQASQSDNLDDALPF